MHIGIDARLYGPEQGGLGRYIEQLILHLEQIPTTDTFSIFLRSENWEAYQPKNKNFRKVMADIPWYGWKEQVLLPKIFEREHVDIMHFPHWNIPLYYNQPFVVTIHDLLLLHFPTRAASTLGPVTYWFKQYMYKKVLRHAAQHAEHILATSEFTKQDIHHTLDIALKKITVTYQAAFLKKEKGSAALQTTPVKWLERLGITKPYLLYVGVAYPHKNLDGLLTAWEIFCAKYGNNYQLVLAGKHNYFYKKLLANQRASKNENKPIFTGFVSDTELETLYKGAALYVFPSFYEGFGLPPLEAMSYNLPIAASNASCLPEILGEAAVYFDPHQPTEMAAVFFKTLTDQAMRHALIAAGQKRYPRFSWKKLAEKTAETYRASLDT